MATTASVLEAERWLDEVIIKCEIDNTAGATMSEQFTLPAGIGDVAILAISCNVVNIATVPGTATANRGVRAVILSPDGAAQVDIVGSAEWLAMGGTLAAFDAFTASIDADALTLWRQTELLSFSSAEMDVNASPTGDFKARVKCVRVRPIEAPAGQGPIQLVRTL